MIRLAQNLALTADDHCYILGKPAKPRGKSCELSNRSYHTTPAQAVSAAVLRAMRQGVADGSIVTLRQFITEQARLQAELERLIAPLEGSQDREGE